MYVYVEPRDQGQSWAKKSYLESIQIVAALALLGVLIPAFLINAAQDTEPKNAAFTGIAQSLFTTWAVPFEIASLVLLVALIGAIIIARSGPGEN